MNKKTRNILIYAAIVIVIVTLILIFQSYNDLLTMILFGLIIVITSIFTYGNRGTR